MPHNPNIILHQLCYSLPVGKVIFSSLNCTITSVKTGLIGKNGIGKSTLLKLICQQLLPSKGSIETSAKLAYLPQNMVFPAGISVAEILGIRQKLAAMQRIFAGSTEETDFAIVNEDWLCETNCRLRLAEFNLDYLDLAQDCSTLSGGELTKLLLVKIFNSDANFLLLDEPTNHLDQETRQLVYQKIRQWPHGILISTHDRQLLENVEQIIELTTLGIEAYGGNYDFYLEQKSIMQTARQQNLLDAQKHLEKTSHSVQLSRERREQRQSKGVKARRLGKIDKLAANAARGRSEKTQHRLSLQKEKLLTDARDQLQEAKAHLEVEQQITIDMPETFVPNGKLILQIDNVAFSYTLSQQPIINNFSLTLSGAQRIALAGKNGSGKTTLVKLILRELMPQLGDIHLGTERINYLDQNISLLHPQQTVLENFLRINPDCEEETARRCLAKFLFRNKEALGLVADLSGGERLRAVLACVLMSTKPPQLLILDEPTNHLDLPSVAVVESALNCYQGALIIISHDKNFLSNLCVDKVITAPFVGN